MNYITPASFRIAATSSGFDILVKLSNGSDAVWGKDIKTARGAKCRLTTFLRRNPGSVAEAEEATV